MVARDLPRCLGPSTSLRAVLQWAHTRELEDDLLTLELDIREDASDHLEEIINFRFGAACFVGILDGDIRSANDDLVKQGEDEHDAPILVLKEELVLADSGSQFGVIENQVRTFGPADITVANPKV